MKTTYLKDRKKEIAQLKLQASPEILTEKHIAHLPFPIRQHYKHCGFLDQPIAMNADVIWKDSYIKLKQGQKWRKLKTLQFNSVRPLMRTSFMKVSNMFFAGKDLYKEGQGTMIGKLFNLFPIINASGEELSQSALITIFCEMLLVSGYALQDYVEWQEIDHCTVSAILSDHNFKVKGVFHFDKMGKFHHFETDDRFYDTGKGKFEKKKFKAFIDSYQMKDHHYIPENVRVQWCLENGDYDYFTGTIQRIDYNVEK